MKTAKHVPLISHASAADNAQAVRSAPAPSFHGHLPPRIERFYSVMSRAFLSAIPCELPAVGTL